MSHKNSQDHLAFGPSHPDVNSEGEIEATEAVLRIVDMVADSGPQLTKDGREKVASYLEILATSLRTMSDTYPEQSARPPAHPQIQNGEMS